MNICFAGKNFDNIPSLGNLMSDMRDSGEIISIFNYKFGCKNKLDIEADLYIFVNIDPLRIDKKYTKITKGMTEDEIIYALSNFSEDLISETTKNQDIIPEVKETIIIESATNNDSSIMKKIISFEFIIDGQQVILSKEDTDYLIKVFDTAKQNGYTLVKVITNEEANT